MDCLYLCPTSSSQGSHELLHIQKHEVVLRCNCTSMPMTPSIIKQVHKLTEFDCIPDVAGVDYDAEEFDDNNDYSTDEEDDD
eukprot:4430568-Ditylum_brightwellii.AAC.1